MQSDMSRFFYFMSNDEGTLVPQSSIVNRHSSAECLGRQKLDKAKRWRLLREWAEQSEAGEKDLSAVA